MPNEYTSVMIESRPSATAFRVAVRRAAHQLVDDPKVFDDPLALRIIGSEAAAKLRAGSSETQNGISSALRAFFAARSRYAEDQLASAITRGASQYVILGAGLDTFAYRNSYSSKLHVYEVDHPATQVWKKELLQAAGISLPNTLTFVPVDFERDQLSDALSSSAFRMDRITFFSWLGVVPYLTEDAMASTLRFIASMPSQSGVVFDYAVPRESLDFVGRLAFDALASRVSAAGEPFQLFFTPQGLREKLQKLGFADFEALDAAEMNRRYFGTRGDDLRIRGDLARFMTASI